VTESPEPSQPSQSPNRIGKLEPIGRRPINEERIDKHKMEKGVVADAAPANQASRWASDLMLSNTIYFNFAVPIRGGYALFKKD
jgi:hypothetical protein